MFVSDYTGRGEEEGINICPIFRAHTDLLKEKLEKPFPASAEST